MKAQYKLVTEGLGIPRLLAVTGLSSGAADTVQFAVSYPEFMDTISAMIQAEGVSFINPCDALFGRRKGLPASFLTADGGHGNANYGAMAIQLLRDQGLIQTRS